MAFVSPIVLTAHGVCLVPLALDHEPALRDAAADGQLWNLRVTSVPRPEETGVYITTALKGRAEGHRFPFAVVEEASGTVIGSTSYHDILPEVRRLEIGYTWYARRAKRTHVNSACKMLLMAHAFETLRCNVVGWRTDIHNVISQRAIERLGAKKVGVIRGNALRRDGTIRDTVMYSLHRDEWPEVRSNLNRMLSQAGRPASDPVASIPPTKSAEISD